MILLLSRDGETRFYRDDIGPWAGSTSDEQEVMSLVRDFLTDPNVVKVGHNAGYYDQIVMEENFGITPFPLFDTILGHRLAESEFKHGLGFIGSLYTDVPSWKSEHTATQAKTDHELGAYCATDVAVNDAIVPIIKETILKRQQGHLYKYDVKLQEMCRDMHRLGMRIDESRRQEHEVKFEAEKEHYLLFLQKAGIENPNSHDQVRALLFDSWRLPVPNYTKAGEPSTDNDSLIELMRNPHADEYQRSVIDAVRMYRRADTILSRYLYIFAPYSDLVRDGYVHADFNTHGTVARLSSSGPNFQNIPALLRDIFIPPPGCVFIDADMDQIELRFIAGISGCRFYLDRLNAGDIDPHNIGGELMFGDTYWQLPGAPKTKAGKGEGVFADARTSSKTIIFASGYGAKGPKVAEIYLSTVDKKSGKLLYLRETKREVEVRRNRWLRNVPEIPKWWEASVDFWRTHGYIQEPVMGRRRYFAWEDTNAIINFGPQAGGFAVVTLGMIDIQPHIPTDPKRRTGLVNQMHDSVTYAVPESRADELSQLVETKLTRRVESLGVSFTAKAKVLERWGK